MLADRHLQLLAWGALLAALDLPFEAGPVPLGLPLRLAGVALVATALWGLRPADKPLERRATRDLTTSSGLIALWGILLTLQLLSNARGGLIGPLAQVVLLIPFVLLGRVMLRFAQREAWSYAARAWRRTLFLAAVCYGSAALVYAVSWLVGAFAGVTVDPAGHPALDLVGPLLLLLPAAALVVAVARTSRDQAQLQGEDLTPLATWVHHPAAPVALLAILLLPHWGVSIPRQVHHALTPSFAEHARTRRAVSEVPALPEGCKQLAFWTGPTWRHGVVAPLRPTSDPFPEGLRSQSYTLQLELDHGSERLLSLEHELLATIDVDTNTLDGFRVRARRATVQQGFRLVLHTRVDLDAPKEAAAAGGVHRVPFDLHIELLAGRGTLLIGGERVRGLPAVEPDGLWTDAPAPGGLTLRGGPISGTLPADDGGLRYALRVQGSLLFRSNGELVLDVPTRTRFSLNGDEYSYTLRIDERLVQQDTKPQLTRRKGPATLSRRRTWRGVPW